jgi:hypothetical protein
MDSIRAWDRDGNLLRPGDVITSRGEEWIFDYISRGPLRSDGRSCKVCVHRGEGVWPNKQSMEYYHTVFNLRIEEDSGNETFHSA